MRAVRCSILVIALVGSSLVPAAAMALADELPKPRELRVRLTTEEVQARESLTSGRYRIQVRAPGRSPGLLLLVKPDRGYTRADLRADNRRRSPAASRRIREGLRFFGGVEMRAGKSGVLWETLYSGRYWLVGLSARAPRVSIKTVHVHGTPFASSFPRVSAAADSVDRGRVRVTRRVPQSGRILVRNSSHRLDLMFFLPLERGVSYREFLRVVRRDGFPVRLRGSMVTAQLSPNAGYVLRYRLRPGRYVAMGIRGFTSVVGPRHPRLRQLVRPVTVRRGSPATSSSAAGLSPQCNGLQHALPAPHDVDWPAWATSRLPVQP